MSVINVNKIVDDAIINLSLEFPIYADFIIRIGYQIVHGGKDRAPAWTDGTCLTVNADAIEDWNLNPVYYREDIGKEVNRTIRQQEMQFLLCHELMHLLTLTTDRAKNIGLEYEALYQAAQSGKITDEDLRKKELWNQASDYEINALLWENESRDSEFGDMRRHPVGNMPELGLYDEKYRGWIAEEIYKDLVEKEKQENNGMLLKPQFPIGIDEHMPIKNQQTKNEVLAKISEVQQAHEKGNSLGESALDRAIDRNFKPVPFNWRKALTKYIRSYIKSNYTWNKPSRAGIASNLILPSSGTTPSLHVGVAIDTSGSITEAQIQEMMNHVFTILQQFKSFTVDLWACGSVVYKESLMHITNQNKKDLLKFNPISDGGNDMRENFKFIKEHYKGKDKIDLMIILSDFIDPLDGDTETTSPCPCVFLCIDHKEFKKPSKIRGEVYPYTVDGD